MLCVHFVWLNEFAPNILLGVLKKNETYRITRLTKKKQKQNKTAGNRKETKDNAQSTKNGVRASARARMKRICVV